MEYRRTNQLKSNLALGLMLPAMMAAATESAQARPANKPDDTFSIYRGDRAQQVNFYADRGAANAYLNETNIHQAMKDARVLVDTNLGLSVNFATGNGNYELDFTLSRLVDEPLHDLHLTKSQDAATTESPMGCAPTWNPQNPYETTYDCDTAASVETFMVPAPANVRSVLWPGTNVDVLTMAKGACRNVFDANFTLAQLNPLFNGRADGGKFLEVRDAVRYLACESFAGALATKTAGQTYQQYAAAAQENLIVGNFDGLDFKVPVPTLPKAAWSGLNAAQARLLA